MRTHISGFPSGETAAPTHGLIESLRETQSQKHPAKPHPIPGPQKLWDNKFYGFKPPSLGTIYYIKQ